MRFLYPFNDFRPGSERRLLPVTTCELLSLSVSKGSRFDVEPYVPGDQRVIEYPKSVSRPSSVLCLVLTGLEHVRHFLTGEVWFGQFHSENMNSLMVLTRIRESFYISDNISIIYILDNL